MRHTYIHLLVSSPKKSCRSFFDFCSALSYLLPKSSILIFLVLFFLLHLLSHADTKGTKESSGAKNSLSFPERFLIRMESGDISDKDIRELEKLAKKGDQEAIATLAQFYGEVSGNISKSLELLAPLLFEKNSADEIIRLSSKKSKNDEILSKIPAVSLWRKEEKLASIALSRILAVNGKIVPASQGFDLVGMNSQGMFQALAAEGVGDMNYLLKRWQESVQGYEFALRVFEWMKGQSEYEIEKDSVSAAAGRIRRKLAKAQKMWDSERYGPEFVAYREARKAELSGDYPVAVLRYSQILESYPDTVYSEAAGLYGPLCLLKLSDPDAKTSLQKKIEEKEKKLRDEIKKLKSASKNIAERILAEWQELVDEDQKILDELKKIPIAKKAEKEGISQLENFIAKNEFGLYRGEGLVKLAEWTFVKELDIDKAFEKYQRAKKWLNDVEKTKLDIAKWAVPIKAVAITIPPPCDKMVTGWNNYLVKTPIKAEQIINRNNCSWYLDSLRCECDKALGYIYYLKGNSEQALELSKSILKYDRMEKKFYDEQDANTYQRMQLFYPRGWLYAPPEELAFFKDKILLAFQISEFYYVQEEWEKAHKLRLDIYNGKYGKLNREEEAIMIYRLADSLVWLEGNDKSAIKLLQPFAEGKYKGTYIYPIALYGLATLDGKYLDDKDAMLRTIAYCEEALKYVKDKDGDLADKIKYFIANRYFKSLYKIHKDENALKKAQILYNDIVKNPKSRWRKLALKYLAEIEK